MLWLDSTTKSFYNLDTSWIAASWVYAVSIDDNRDTSFLAQKNKVWVGTFPKNNLIL